MKSFILFLIFFFERIIYNNSQTNKCISLDTIESSQCSYCPFTSYVNDITIFSSPSLFNINLCLLKNTVTTYTKTVYISSLVSSPCLACDGTINNPFSDLYQTIIAISFEASKYKSSQITFYLMGPTHWILRSKILINGAQIFKKLNSDIQILALMCSESNVAGCFLVGQKPIVYLKTDNFQFFVTKSLLIKNIIFDGSDNHLTELKDVNGCFNMNKKCCQTSTIENQAGNTDNLNCYINPASLSISNRDNKQKSLGLFNLFIEFDNSAATIPNLKLTDCEFKNFYSIRDDSSTGLSVGTSIFFGFYNNLPGNIVASNIKVEGGYYRYGFIQRINDGSIIHNLISSPGDPVRLDLNDTLKTPSNVVLSNFSISGFNKIKIQNLDTLGYLFYFGNSPGTMEFNDILIFDSFSRNSIVYANPEGFSKLFSLYMKKMNITATQAYALYQLISCDSHLFVDNYFKENTLTYGFLIKLITLFTFERSYTAGKALPKNEYFSVDSSSLLIYNSTFKNMIIDDTSIKYYFIKTTTKIYVASDTQFQTSIPSANPYSNDIITINQTYIENCNFLIFVNEHSVLYFNLVNSYFKNMPIDSVSVAISLTVERQITFDNLTLDGLRSKSHFVALLAGRNFSYINSKIINCELISFILLMVVIPLDYKIIPYVYCNISRNLFSNITIIKTSEIVQFIESQPISRGYGFHWLLINDNIFEEILNPSAGADYLLYFAGGHSNMINNTFKDMKLLEVCRFFPRIPSSILTISNCKFLMIKYHIQHFFIITIGYYVHELYIINSYFEAGKSLNFSSGLEFLNIGTFSIKDSTIKNIKSQTGNALTVNTASLLTFFVKNCYFYSNAGANNNGADIVLGVANKNGTNWDSLIDFKNIYFGIFNSTFDTSQESGSLTLMDNGEMFIYKSYFKHIRGGSGAVLNIGSNSRIYISNIDIFNVSSTDNGGCFQMMATYFILMYSVIDNVGSKQIGGVLIATENSDISITKITVKNTFSLKGGVISTEDSILNLTDSEFGFSNSTSQGGHFYLKKSNIYFKNVNLTNGVSLTAGSVYGELVTVTFIDIIIKNCSCDLQKGLGTVQLIGSDSRSKFQNVLCEGNIAMTGTCIFAKDIKLDITDSKFIENSASVHSIIEIFFSSLATELIIDKCLFALNKAENSLIKSKNTYVNISNTDFLDNIFGNYGFLLDQVTFNNYKINLIVPKNMPSSINSDMYCIYITNSATALIRDVVLDGGSSVGGIFCMTCGNLTLYKMTIKNGVGTYGAGIRSRSSYIFLTQIDLAYNNATQGGGAIYLEDSETIIINTSFKSNAAGTIYGGKGSDIYCNNVQISKYHNYSVRINNSFTKEPLGSSIYVTYSDLEIEDFEFQGSIDKKSQGIECSNCLTIDIFNVSFVKLKNMSALNINNNLKSLSQLILTNISFIDCSTDTMGGAINMIGYIKSNIKNTKFINNYAATKGGAVYYENTLTIGKSDFVFRDTLFENNFAEANGGAIFTTNTLVDYDSSVQFKNNNASNGANIYSYPSKLLIIENTTDNLADLQTYVKNNFLKDYLDKKLEYPITFKTKSGMAFSFGILIIDDYNNVLDSETDTICEINQLKTEKANETSVDVENNIAKLTEGMAIFSRVSIVEESNSTYHFYVSYTGNGDYSNLNRTFDIYVQKCGRGEIFNEKRCISCEENFYSLEPDPEIVSIMVNKTIECDTCPSNALCPGGEKIIPETGYWRLSENTSSIVKCFPSESCPHQDHWMTQNTFELTFECGKGYAGNLCALCDKNYGEYHSGCYDCSDGGYHYALYFFKFWGCVIIIVYEAYSALNKENSITKCLFRIFVNHTVYLIAFTALNLSLSDQFKTLFGQINSNLSVSPTDVFNYHCLLRQSTKDENLYSANLAIQVIAPLIYGSFSLTIKIIIDLFYTYCTNKEKKKLTYKKFKLNFIVCFFLSYRNWYARTLISIMELFKCIDLGDSSDVFLKSNPNVMCWGEKHNKMLYGSIFPGIITWVIFVPAFLVYYLRKNSHLTSKREVFTEISTTKKQMSMSKKAESIKSAEDRDKPSSNLNASSTLGRASTTKIKKSESVFFYLTIDYQKKYYYWISVENGITFGLLMISQIIAGLEDKIQRMILFICFAVLFLIYQKLEPFELKINNSVASFSIAIALLTIIFQMIGSNENNTDSVVNFSVGMIIFLNIFFYLCCGFIVVLQKNETFKKKLNGFVRLVWRSIFRCFRRG